MRVERLAHRLDAGDAVALEDAVELAAGRLDAGDQALHPLVLAQIGGDRGERALEIVLHAQHVAGEAGRGICGGVELLLLQPAADVLGLGLGVEDVLAHLLQLLLQLGQPVELGLAASIRALAPSAVDFVLKFASVFVHAINLDNVLAVKSTMGTTRA